jgi:amidase
MTELGWASAYQVAAAIRRREVSAAEVLTDQLDRIQRRDARLRSVVTLDADGAQRRAAEADRALARGQVWGPLHGVGVTVEDVHATAGMRSAFGGYRPFAEHVPAADATVVARLKAAGATIVGKSNGPCLWGEDSVFPPTLNPWNADRTAGGSSTGPAVAVAAGLTPFDIAGDTSGSIQCPAAFCGVFGMRPTEHRVPVTGMLYINPVRQLRALVTAGPVARSVGDLRLALEVIGGPDGHDPEVPPVPWHPAGPADLNGLRVAYSPGFPSLVDAEIRAGADRLAAELDELGAVVEDRLPDPALARYGQLVEEFLAVLDSGSVQEYLAILDRRDRFIASWDRFFAGCDVFLAPAMPGARLAYGRRARRREPADAGLSRPRAISGQRLPDGGHPGRYRRQRGSVRPPADGPALGRRAAPGHRRGDCRGHRGIPAAAGLLTGPSD